MPNGFRLVLPDHLLAVQAFFNAWPDADFLPMLRSMSDGVESTYNEVGWSWSGGEDEALPPSGRVLFFCGDDEAVIGSSEALAHLETAVKAYLVAHPDDTDEAHLLIDKIRAKLHAGS